MHLKQTVTVRQNEELRYKITASTAAQIALNDGQKQINNGNNVQSLCGSYSFADSELIL